MVNDSSYVQLLRTLTSEIDEMLARAEVKIADGSSYREGRAVTSSNNFAPTLADSTSTTATSRLATDLRLSSDFSLLSTGRADKFSRATNHNEPQFH